MQTVELSALQYAELCANLEASGMPPIPTQFSVVNAGQTIPRRVVEDIEAFVRVFDAVTTRPAWRDHMLRSVPPIARTQRKEVCFFSAWDFHLPQDAPDSWQLIEFNDNGSGFLFAALINENAYRLAQLETDPSIESVKSQDDFAGQLMHMVELEARTFFGALPDGLFLILDDNASLRQGRFWQEHKLLCDLLRRSGFRSAICAAGDLLWTGEELRYEGQPISFIVNRSTDFLWQSDLFDALKSAYNSHRVYVAPNPFTYATRSDKRLMEYLSNPVDDPELGITPEERKLLNAHIPRTFLVTSENARTLAEHKDELVFKPARGFAGRGVIEDSRVGLNRLRQILRKRKPYVAQKKVAKSRISVPGKPHEQLWCDLRVWAYRGKSYLLTGRASLRPDRLDLDPPGGWLPTFIYG